MAETAVQTTPTEARIAALAAPKGGWSAPARDAALGRVRKMGLPTRRDEYWKYTRPDTLVAVDTPEAAVFHADEAPIFDSVDKLQIVFVD
ncbi:MAG: Fe-S cluster assembly protein SufD, partial [Pseudomonadota bacterium]